MLDLHFEFHFTSLTGRYLLSIVALGFILLLLLVLCVVLYQRLRNWLEVRRRQKLLPRIGEEIFNQTIEDIINDPAITVIDVKELEIGDLLGMGGSGSVRKAFGRRKRCL